MREITPNKWEDHIKRSLEGYDPDWEAEELWGSIEQQLPRAKKKRRFLLIWLLIGTTTLFGVRQLSSLKPYTEIVGDELESLSVEQVPPSSAKVENTNHLEALPDESPLLLSAPFTDEGKLDGNYPPIEAEVAVPAALPNFSKAQDSIRSSTIPKLLTKPFAKLSQPQKELTLPLEGKEELATKTLNTKPISLLENLLPTVPVATDKTTRPKISLHPYLSVAISQRSLNALNQAYENAVTQRVDTEKPLESVAVGILLNLALHRNWSVQFGLERQQLTERFQWNGTSQRTITMESDSAYYFFDGQNERHFTAGELEITETTTRSTLHYNRYTLYNAPILVEYHQRKGKLGWQLSGGGIVNLSHTANGLFLADETTADIAALENENLYRSNVGLAWQLGAGVNYILLPNAQLGLDLYHRSFLNPFTSSEVQYEQRYQVMGVRLSLRYFLK